MEITKTVDYHSVTLFLDGMLDTHGTPALSEETEKITPETKKVILDFGKLRYISSAGLRGIIIIFKKMKAQGGELEVANCNDEVMEIFKMTGFDNKFPVKQRVNSGS